MRVEQHGLGRKHSCLTNLISFLEYLTVRVDRDVKVEARSPFQWEVLIIVPFQNYGPL